MLRRMRIVLLEFIIFLCYIFIRQLSLKPAEKMKTLLLVHDHAGTGARHGIDRDAPPQCEQLLQKMGQ